MMYRGSVSVFALLAALTPQLALAQTNRPPVVEPGRVQRALERDRLKSLPQVELPEAPATPEAKPISDKASFTLKGVTFARASAYSQAELEAQAAEFIGKPAGLSTLNAIAARVTAFYRNNGYILTRAIVPPQRIKDGTATITIVEGFVDQVVFEGMEASDLLRSYGEKIRAAKPLNTKDLERYLLLMQDLPGLTARAVLRPSPSVPGASDVVVTLSQKKFDGAFNIDNRGTRYLGPVQGGLTLNGNNLLGLHDRTQFRHIRSIPHTDELGFFQLSHDEQVGSEGTRVTLAASRTRTRPNYRLRTFDIDGRDTLLSAIVTHPLLRSRAENLFGSAQFDVRNTESKSLNQLLYGDRLRVARIGASYDVVDKFSAVNRLDTQLSKGFGWSDNVKPDVRSRAGGDTSFWKLTAQASRLQPVYGDFSLFLGAQGQLASGKLLSAEQFGVGGANFGSAYDPSEITGDSGIATRTELQYTPNLSLSWLTGSQFYGFYDIGRVYTRNPAAGLKDDVSLASAGAGIRFNVLEPLSGSLEVAKPLTKQVSTAAPRNGNDTRVFFSLGYRF